jgi:two-component system sensor histidine kinase KdpD
LTGDDRGPDPEALLAAVAKEGSGRLKVFLGSAPGVGKTYDMLQAAHERKREGTDLVIGILETHGRQDTERMALGLEVLPRLRVNYRGVILGEMDLDGILARHPQLVLVDELAHTNAPGLRHAKRYQDVEEILAAGIDVYTTVNIQHIESRRDLVQQITGVWVQETVPDRVLEQAAEITLIDLPPTELIQRLQEGKVYVPEQAVRAIHRFFNPGNLIALREMAMEFAVEHVDASLVNYMHVHSVPGPLPARFRILACIGLSPHSERIVRYVRRRAERRQAPWVALHVELEQRAYSEAERNRLEAVMHLVERLGGESVVVPGRDVAEEVLAYAVRHNVTAIVLGRGREYPWPWLGRGRDISAKILARGTGYEVTFVPDEEGKPGRFSWPRWRAAVELPVSSLLPAALTVLVATGFAWGLKQTLPGPNISLAFLMGVLFVSIRYGLAPAILAALLSFLSYDYFFTVPYYSLAVKYTGEFTTIVFFLVVAVITANLASRVRAQVLQLRRTNQQSRTLLSFSRSLASATSAFEILGLMETFVERDLGLGAAGMLVPQGGSEDLFKEVRAQLGEVDRAAARWVAQHGQVAGWSTETLGAASWLFLPVQSRRGVIAVLGIAAGSRPERLTRDARRLLEAVCDQAAIAIERTLLVSDVEEARVSMEGEQLRSALLASVSHDLRTPLAAIIGSVSSLADYGSSIGPEDQRELLRTTLEEARRLNRYIQNLLDMTKLGQAGYTIQREWADLAEIVGSVVQRLQPSSGSVRIETFVPDHLPLLFVQAALIEQALLNLVENAIKYSPPQGTVSITVTASPGQIGIDVCDQGVGIPDTEKARVFDMFYRVHLGDRQPPGMGLGLAIARGLIQAHGGQLSVLDGPGGKGTRMRVLLPITSPEQVALGGAAGA